MIYSYQQQIKVTEQDIVTNRSSLKDAYYQYQSGIADKTDYKRATISLNNAKAKKNSDESLKAKYAYLKRINGLPASQDFQLVYDSAQMANEILLDTLQNVNYTNRIEVQLLETQKKLQQYNLQYYKWSFLPEISAFGNYNLNFLNNKFSKLYSQSLSQFLCRHFTFDSYFPGRKKIAANKTGGAGNNTG